MTAIRLTFNTPIKVEPSQVATYDYWHLAEGLIS